MSMSALKQIEAKYGPLNEDVYQRLARRTFKGGHLSREAQAMYHGLKIAEETWEVFNASSWHHKDEAGDVIWHVAGLLDALGMSLGGIPLDDGEGRFGSFLTALPYAIKIGSMLAKHYGQGQPLDLVELVRCIALLLHEVISLVDADWYEVMAANILKLEERHADMLGVAL